MKLTKGVKAKQSQGRLAKIENKCIVSTIDGAEEQAWDLPQWKTWPVRPVWAVRRRPPCRGPQRLDYVCRNAEIGDGFIARAQIAQLPHAARCDSGGGHARFRDERDCRAEQIYRRQSGGPWRERLSSTVVGMTTPGYLGPSAETAADHRGRIRALPRDTSQLAKQVAGYVGETCRTKRRRRYGNTQVIGVTSNYAEIANLVIAEGSFSRPTRSTARKWRSSGRTWRRNFFRTSIQLGKTVQAETHTYEVVGVGGRIGSALGRSKDHYLLLPLGTYLKGSHEADHSLAVFVQAPNAECVRSARGDRACPIPRLEAYSLPRCGYVAVLGSKSLWPCGTS